MIDYDIEEELKPILSPDEKLKWTGKPKTGIILRSSDIFLIPFSLLWGGFAVYWEMNAFSMDTPLFFKLWGIPFVLIGLYITAGRFFLDARKRANTIYGITHDRIIIKSGIFKREIKSLNIKTLSDITLNQKDDGTGSILLGPSDFRYNMLQGMEWPGMKQAPRLELIDEVKSVYDMIIGMQKRG